MGRVCQDPGKGFEATLRDVCVLRNVVLTFVLGKVSGRRMSRRGERVDELLERIDHNPERERILTTMFEGYT